jgi:hypothetical protein
VELVGAAEVAGGQSESRPGRGREAVSAQMDTHNGPLGPVIYTARAEGHEQIAFQEAATVSVAAFKFSLWWRISP